MARHSAGLPFRTQTTRSKPIALRGMHFGSRPVKYSVREHHGFADFSLAGCVFVLPDDFSATNYEHPMFLLFAGVKEIVAFR